MTEADPTVPERLRVLFLGTNISPISVAVLEAITASDEFEVAVLAPRGSLLKTIRRTWRDHGPGMVLRGGLRMARAGVRGMLRRIGLHRGAFLSMADLVRTRGIDLLRVEGINDADTVARVGQWSPDLLLVAVFDKILKPAVIDVPRLGCVNVHPSLLPAYRGPNPVYWVVANGETQTGVTFHQIDEGVDTGALLLQREYAIEPGASEPAVRRGCAVLAGEMAPEVLRGLRDGTAVPRAQDEAVASYFGQPPRGASRL